MTGSPRLQWKGRWSWALTYLDTSFASVVLSSWFSGHCLCDFFHYNCWNFQWKNKLKRYASCLFHFSWAVRSLPPPPPPKKEEKNGGVIHRKHTLANPTLNHWGKILKIIVFIWCNSQKCYIREVWRELLRLMESHSCSKFGGSFFRFVDEYECEKWWSWKTDSRSSCPVLWKM